MKVGYHYLKVMFCVILCVAGLFLSVANAQDPIIDPFETNAVDSLMAELSSKGLNLPSDQVYDYEDWLEFPSFKIGYVSTIVNGLTIKYYYYEINNQGNNPTIGFQMHSLKNDQGRDLYAEAIQTARSTNYYNNGSYSYLDDWKYTNNSWYGWGMSDVVTFGFSKWNDDETRVLVKTDVLTGVQTIFTIDTFEKRSKDAAQDAVANILDDVTISNITVEKYSWPYDNWYGGDCKVIITIGDIVIEYNYSDWLSSYDGQVYSDYLYLSTIKDGQGKNLKWEAQKIANKNYAYNFVGWDYEPTDDGDKIVFFYSNGKDASVNVEFNVLTGEVTVNIMDPFKDAAELAVQAQLAEDLDILPEMVEIVSYERIGYDRAYVEVKANNLTVKYMYDESSYNYETHVNEMEITVQSIKNEDGTDYLREAQNLAYQQNMSWWYWMELVSWEYVTYVSIPGETPQNSELVFQFEAGDQMSVEIRTDVITGESIVIVQDHLKERAIKAVTQQLTEKMWVYEDDIIITADYPYWGWGDLEITAEVNGLTLKYTYYEWDDWYTGEKTVNLNLSSLVNADGKDLYRDAYDIARKDSHYYLDDWRYSYYNPKEITFGFMKWNDENTRVLITTNVSTGAQTVFTIETFAKRAKDAAKLLLHESVQDNEAFISDIIVENNGWGYDNWYGGNCNVNISVGEIVVEYRYSDWLSTYNGEVNSQNIYVLSIKDAQGNNLKNEAQTIADKNYTYYFVNWDYEPGVDGNYVIFYFTDYDKEARVEVWTNLQTGVTTVNIIDPFKDAAELAVQAKLAEDVDLELDMVEIVSYERIGYDRALVEVKARNLTFKYAYDEAVYNYDTNESEVEIKIHQIIGENGTDYLQEAKNLANQQNISWMYYMELGNWEYVAHVSIPEIPNSNSELVFQFEAGDEMTVEVRFDVVTGESDVTVQDHLIERAIDVVTQQLVDKMWVSEDEIEITAENQWGTINITAAVNGLILEYSYDEWGWYPGEKEFDLDLDGMETADGVDIYQEAKDIAREDISWPTLYDWAHHGYYVYDEPSYWGWYDSSYITLVFTDRADTHVLVTYNKNSGIYSSEVRTPFQDKAIENTKWALYVKTGIYQSQMELVNYSGGEDYGYVTLLIDNLEYKVKYTQTEVDPEDIYGWPESIFEYWYIKDADGVDLLQKAENEAWDNKAYDLDDFEYDQYNKQLTFEFVDDLFDLKVTVTVDSLTGDVSSELESDAIRETKYELFNRTYIPSQYFELVDYNAYHNSYSGDYAYVTMKSAYLEFKIKCTETENEYGWKDYEFDVQYIKDNDGTDLLYKAEYEAWDYNIYDLDSWRYDNSNNELICTFKDDLFNLEVVVTIDVLTGTVSTELFSDAIYKVKNEIYYNSYISTSDMEVIDYYAYSNSYSGDYAYVTIKADGLDYKIKIIETEDEWGWNDYSYDLQSIKDADGIDLLYKAKSEAGDNKAYDLDDWSYNKTDKTLTFEFTDDLFDLEVTVTVDVLTGDVSSEIKSDAIYNTKWHLYNDTYISISDMELVDYYAYANSYSGDYAYVTLKVDGLDYKIKCTETENEWGWMEYSYELYSIKDADGIDLLYKAESEAWSNNAYDLDSWYYDKNDKILTFEFTDELFNLEVTITVDTLTGDVFTELDSDAIYKVKNEINYNSNIYTSDMEIVAYKAYRNSYSGNYAYVTVKADGLDYKIRCTESENEWGWMEYSYELYSIKDADGIDLLYKAELEAWANNAGDLDSWDYDKNDKTLTFEFTDDLFDLEVTVIVDVLTGEVSSQIDSDAIYAVKWELYYNTYISTSDMEIVAYKAYRNSYSGNYAYVTIKADELEFKIKCLETENDYGYMDYTFELQSIKDADGIDLKYKAKQEAYNYKAYDLDSWRYNQTDETITFEFTDDLFDLEVTVTLDVLTGNITSEIVHSDAIDRVRDEIYYKVWSYASYSDLVDYNTGYFYSIGNYADVTLKVNELDFRIRHYVSVENDITENIFELKSIKNSDNVDLFNLAVTEARSQMAHNFDGWSFDYYNNHLIFEFSDTFSDLEVTVIVDIETGEIIQQSILNSDQQLIAGMNYIMDNVSVTEQLNEEPVIEQPVAILVDPEIVIIEAPNTEEDLNLRNNSGDVDAVDFLISLSDTDENADMIDNTTPTEFQINEL